MGNQDVDRSVGKVRQLMERLQGRRSLLIVMQDNPDPDSIASAAALRRIANHLGDVPCSIAYGGKIGRSENRALAEYLGLNFRPIDAVDPSKFDAVALIDRPCTRPQFSNKACSQAVEIARAGFVQVQVIGEESPDPDREPRKAPALDPAVPAHETGGQAPGYAISQQEIQLLLLAQGPDKRCHGSGD